MNKEFNVSYKYNNGFEEVYIMTTSGKTVVRPATRRYFFIDSTSSDNCITCYLYVKGLNWGVGNRFSPDFSTYLFTEEEYSQLVEDGVPDRFTKVEGHYNT